MQKINKIVVYGGGSWGTALANYASTISNDSYVLTIENEVAEDINVNSQNSKYLKNIKLHRELKASTDISIIGDADIIIIAVPSFAFTDAITAVKEHGVSPDTVILIATKGLAENPVELFSSRIKQLLPNNKYGFISGPNFAAEVAKGMPASMTLSSTDIRLTERLQRYLTTDVMEITITNDIITQQIAGIVKNIIAISSGILAAKGGGENARATLISKGLKEIAIISKHLGGKPETLVEPAVVGDLILTSLSDTSRNTTFGREFHNSGYSSDFIDNYPILVEGVQSARLLSQLIDLNQLDVPVVRNIAELVS